MSYFIEALLNDSLSHNQRINALKGAIAEAKVRVSSAEVAFDLMEEGVDDEDIFYEEKDNALAELEFLRRELKNEREIQKARAAKRKAERLKEAKRNQKKGKQS